MKEKILFRLKSLYRESMVVRGYCFGSGKKSVCIVGSTRGNEVQQTFICSELVRALKRAEQEGRFAEGKSVMVVPTLNAYSMNIGKRFWSTDNTDINRMFPGYAEGETTQRIAAGVFEKIQGYEYGIQFTSFYIPGRFLPHVKIMRTEYMDTEAAKLFSLPYVVIRNPRPYDTATLNYNWQIWNTKAFSLYSGHTDRVDESDKEYMVQSVLTFLCRVGVLRGEPTLHGVSLVVNDADFVSIHSQRGGIFLPRGNNNGFVREGEALAIVQDVMTGETVERIYAPCRGRLYYTFRASLVRQGTLLFRIIPE